MDVKLWVAGRERIKVPFSNFVSIAKWRLWAHFFDDYKMLECPRFRCAFPRPRHAQMFTFILRLACRDENAKKKSRERKMCDSFEWAAMASGAVAWASWDIHNLYFIFYIFFSLVSSVDATKFAVFSQKFALRCAFSGSLWCIWLFILRIHVPVLYPLVPSSFLFCLFYDRNARTRHGVWVNENVEMMWEFRDEKKKTHEKWTIK